MSSAPIDPQAPEAPLVRLVEELTGRQSLEELVRVMRGKRWRREAGTKDDNNNNNERTTDNGQS